MFDVIRCRDKELVDTRADAEEVGGGCVGVERSAVMLFVFGLPVQVGADESQLRPPCIQL